ncbi:MAG: chemotaxis response regulator protein-glutamate methylesterase [Dehalococcoidia bacterium]
MVPDRIRVLVVDDSAFARSVISKKLESDPDLEVVGFARDGVEALEQVKALRPNVVTLDVTMPRMDGLLALELIMDAYPTPVVMLSALTSEHSQTTIEALELGAVDFFLKPSALSGASFDGAMAELVDKIKVVSTVNGARLKNIANWNRDHRIKAKASPPARTGRMNRVIVLGASTGGPRALAELLPALPKDLPAPILLVQHMPPTFTKSLAQRLNQASDLEVKEAEAGDKVRAGQVLLAPGGYHLMVTKDDEIALNEDPFECGVRPSVNVTMQSAAQTYGKLVLGVVLTGMGNDGTRGSALIRATGGQVLVEDESTCAIFGMPRSIIESGNADRVVPLPDLAQEIIQLCGAPRPRKASVGG